MSVVGWLELREAARAAEWLANSTAHMHTPFNVWTESKSKNQRPTLQDEGCFNFMTGCGGHVQSIFAGYFGLRIKWSDTENLRSMITLDPQLPPGATAMKLRSISFVGARFSAEMEMERGTFSIEICLVEQAGGAGLAVSFAAGSGGVLNAVGQCARGAIGKVAIVHAQ